MLGWVAQSGGRESKQVGRASRLVRTGLAMAWTGLVEITGLSGPSWRARRLEWVGFFLDWVWVNADGGGSSGGGGGGAVRRVEG